MLADQEHRPGRFLVLGSASPDLVGLATESLAGRVALVELAGFLHRLLAIPDHPALLGHPKVGASWEGFVIEQILMLDVSDPWFWGTHGGAELDLLVTIDGKRIGVEVKRTVQPRITPSARQALADLDLDHLLVVHAGDHRFPLGPGITAVPAEQLLTAGFEVP